MKTYLVLVLFLLTGCVAQSNSTKSFYDDTRYKMPPISEDDFPKQDFYYIRTRIVIETAQIQWPETNEKITLKAVTKKKVEDSLLLAEKIYKDVGLKFHVDQYVFMNFQPKINHFWIDATRYSDSLSFYFLLPRADVPFNGLGSGPWGACPWGIILFATANKWTLAHEVGHYFGLLHPFGKIGKEGDCVKDTPVHTSMIGGPNINNIMMYSTFTNKKLPFITAGQIERMQRFLRTKRKLTILKEVPKRF
ncbi:hypothetical protein LCGC14_1661990, partial [marine sediment metagenome]